MKIYLVLEPGELSVACATCDGALALELAGRLDPGSSSDLIVEVPLIGYMEVEHVSRDR